jgi:RimJ/RimL family protein N-acetyltransferase
MVSGLSRACRRFRLLAFFRNTSHLLLQEKLAMSRRPSTDPSDTWTSHERVRTGEEICIRPLRADDREREIAFINSLSERTVYFRLFTPMKLLPPHVLEQLMEIDYDDRMVFVATVQTEAGEQFVGVARYARTKQGDAAEIGITVTDAWQRRGIARLLLARLMQYARTKGIRRMIGFVLPENHPMLCLARAVGFEVHLQSGSGLYEISCDLTTASIQAH